MKFYPFLGGVLGAAIGLAASAFAPQDVSATTISSAVGVGTNSVQFYTHDRLAKFMEENSDLSIKVYPLSLLNLKETPPGIRDGIADMGFVLPPYYPAEYANFNLAADLSMLSTTGRQVKSPGAAMAGATSEYVFFNCPDCQKEFLQQNQIYLGTGSTPTYILLCTAPIRNADDLKGKKLRSGASNFGRWAENFGATKVTIPGNDVYEAMSQGVIDCAMMSATELTNISLFDVTKAITRRVPGGVFSGVATNNVGTSVWRDLTLEQRTAFLKGSARAQADFTWKFYADANRNLEAAPDKGIEIIEPSPELLASTEEFVKADLAVISAQYTRDYRIENADAKIAKIAELVEKWKGLTAGLEDDPEGLAKVYWDEIFSKIDPATYGIQ